jgi:hypothetical protein
MPKVPGIIKVRLQKPCLSALSAEFRILVLILAFSLAVTAGVHGQETHVDWKGMVVDQKGSPVPGATVKLLESALSATTDAEGKFALTGDVAIGIVRKTLLPGNVLLRYADGILHLDSRAAGSIGLEWISPQGTRKKIPVPARNGTGGIKVDLDRVADGLAGAGPQRGTDLHWLRITTSGGVSVFRFLRTGSHGVLSGGPGFAGSGADTRAAAAKTSGGAAKSGGTRAAASAAAAGGLVLEASAAGFFAKRFVQAKASDADLSLALLPASTGLKGRIQDFIGAGNSFRIAFVKPEAAGSRKFVLHYADFAEMAGDTMPQHAFPDSRGPTSSPYGAFAPSWSPDGRSIAYEIGFENMTTAVSRVYIQPLSGARAEGPGIPSTNPRWWSNGSDTSLIWCTSGREDAWSDTATATWRQKVSGGALTGAPELLGKGSYNAGLSPDGRYLATGYRYASMQDRESRERRFLHVYPGHPKASDGSNTDSLQACNGSISRDPAHPSRMLFLDFGVTEEPSYANIVQPRLYAQHRMILIGDYASDAPGRLVDFIDTPASELAAEKTWDDPEWSTHPDFAVATTRDPDGDKTVPTEPKPTQPDIYLIKLSTKESLKVFTGGHVMLPAAWIGPAN